MSASLEERIRRLEDRDDIRDLTHRYCDMVWRGGGAAIADLFTDDGVFIADDKRRFEGREALVNFYAGLAARTSNQAHPYIHNHVITITGDTATATSYIDNRMDDGTVIAGGHYDDAFRRTAWGWRFTVRHHHPLFRYRVSVQK